MPSLNRRQLLVALGGSSALGGCSAPTSRPADDASSRTDAPSSTVASTTVAELEFVVAVLRQPSETAPGRIRASLTNHRDATLGVSGGDPLPISGYVEEVDASGPLLLFPQQSDSINEYRYDETDVPASMGDAVRDGCWHLPNTYYYTLAGRGLRLPPGASVTGDLFPLGHPDATMRVRVASSGSIFVTGDLKLERS